MADPAASPDEIAGALVALLEGIPALGTVAKRSPHTPFQGKTPVVIVRPIQNVHSHQAGSARVAGAKFDQGHLEVRYRDAPLAQQRAATGNATLQQSALEDGLVANRNAIIAALDAHRSLDGAVTWVGEDAGIQEAYNPDGYTVEWDGATWIGFDLLIPYLSCKKNMVPLTT